MKKLFNVFLCTLFSAAGFAQWTSNTLLNTEVSNTRTGDCRTVPTNDGRTWVAYFKNVPAPNNFEMRAQLLDKDGVKLLGPEGVLVNNIAHPTFTTVFHAIVDANNNLIVGFANASTNIIYVNKINTSGAQVWSSGGTVITGGLLPRLCVLGNGDVIVSWLSAVALKAPMQRLNGATGAPVWAAPLDVVPTIASHRTAPGNIHAISGNGFIHVFHDRATASTASNLWAQRYDANGTPQWAAPVQLSNKTTAYNKEYFSVMHNDTLFLGYDGATGLRTDDFVQRVNPDGTLPWAVNGIDFATDNTYYEFNIKIAVAPSTNSVWATSTLTTTTQGSQGVYVQKFDKSTGARQFTDNGKIVYPIVPPPYVNALGISLYSDNLPVLLLGKYNTAVSQFLYATKLNNTGSFVWTGDTIALATAALSKLRMTLNNQVNDQAVAVWVENKGIQDQPYAQPIRIDGKTGLVPPVASFSSNIKTVCRNNTVQYNSTSTGYVTSYFWSFPGGTPSSSTDPNTVVTYPANGTYNVSLTVSNVGGATTSTQNNWVNVVGPLVNAGTDRLIINGDVITLDGSSVNNGTPSIAWTPATGILSGGNTFQPSVNPVNTTTYRLTVTDGAGCVGADDMVVNVLPYCVKVMSAFTPNGDGINDRWLVTTNGGACVKQVIAKVFNRYGGLVYSNENYNNDWDGKYQGKPVADGTYYYVITYKLVTGSGLTLKGDVTILR